ncbi:hypothetical protein EMIHUDRAFT_450891, partial [Emiliania huxleyi CCMP1516]|uniref:Btz domain-containing protein n=2 Tax=Emiliania huxleyi TaxID=2903 RepID=A0A0D3JBY9_EMIH1
MQNRARAAANDRYPSGLMPPDELGKKRGRYVLGEAGSPPTSRALCFAAEVESPASKRARTRFPLSDDPRVEHHRYQEMPAPPVPNGFLANVAVEAPTGPAVDNAVFNPHGGTAMLSVEVSVSNGGSDDDVSSLALAASARRGEMTLLREAAPQMPPPAAAEPSVANLAKQAGPAEPEALGESQPPPRTPPCVPVRMEPRGSVLIHRDGLPGGVMRGGYDRPPRHGSDRWTFNDREGQPGRGYGGEWRGPPPRRGVGDRGPPPPRGGFGGGHEPPRRGRFDDGRGPPRYSFVDGPLRRGYDERAPPRPPSPQRRYGPPTWAPSPYRF